VVRVHHSVAKFIIIFLFGEFFELSGAADGVFDIGYHIGVLEEKVIRNSCYLNHWKQLSGIFK
jgi:hypothetical protein